MLHFIYCYAECHYAECCILFTVMLRVIMLNVLMLSAVAPTQKTSMWRVTSKKQVQNLSQQLLGSLSINFRAPQVR
jgi:hypothetical protein